MLCDRISSNNSGAFILFYVLQKRAIIQEKRLLEVNFYNVLGAIIF